MKISVALCTFHGAEYLPDQLRSICEQTALPDEVVVCDDGSTDRTTSALAEFGARAPFRVRVFHNKRNIGLIRNFEQAISLCEGDVIFLCDQDDYWLPDKIARFTGMFESSPDLEGLFSNASLVADDLKETGADLWTFLGITGSQRKRAIRGDLLQLLLGGNVVFGTTFAIRSRAREFVLPFPETLPDRMLHDGWIALVLACRRTLRGYDDNLSLYRQHQTQATGVADRARLSFAARLRRSGMERRQAIADSLRTIETMHELLKGREGITDADLVPVLSRLEHMRVRLALPTARLGRLMPVASELIQGRYGKHAGALVTAGRDLIL